MKKLGLAVVAASMALAGNAAALGWGSGLGPYEGAALAKLKGMSAKGGPWGVPFNASLHKEYSALAEEALAESDHPHGRWYTRKGYHAALGRRVMPTNPSTWWLPHWSRAELRGWYPKLLKALDYRNNRVRKPAVAARAQAMYDCWVEEEHEDVWTRQLGKPIYQPEDIARCKNAFLAAYAELLREAQDINFRFDRPRSIRTASRADLWPGGPEAGTGASAPSGIATLDSLITAMRSSGTSRVLLKGHTDAVGGSAYNQRLSERRALFIRNELAKNGIGGGRVQFRGVGETELKVNTQNRDVRNRRVSYSIR